MKSGDDSIDHLGTTTDSWWLTDAAETFAFLQDDYGYRLADAEAHFRGHFLRYSGRFLDFVVAFDPEIETMRAEFWAERARDEASALRVWNLLAVRDPGTNYLPARQGFPSVREWASTTMRGWATGLQAHASDVLAGRTSDDLPWTP